MAVPQPKKEEKKEAAPAPAAEQMDTDAPVPPAEGAAGKGSTDAPEITELPSEGPATGVQENGDTPMQE